MKRLASVLPLLLLAACAGDDVDRAPEPGSSGSAGSVRWTSTDRVDAPSGAPTIQTFPPESQAFMKAGIVQYSRDDPRWPSTRREWLAMGERETDFLVHMIWGGLLWAQTRNAPALVERARHELALIGPPSVPLMADVIATGEVGTVADPATGEQVSVKVDDLQRREAAEILGIIGAPAVPATLSALDRAQTKSGRRHAIVALANMGDRGGPDAAQALVRGAEDDDELIRVESIAGMRHLSDGATRSALLGALDDDDELVREKAMESLAIRRDASAAPALRAAADRARSVGRMIEAKRAERAAEICEKNPR